MNKDPPLAGTLELHQYYKECLLFLGQTCRAGVGGFNEREGNGLLTLIISAGCSSPVLPFGSCIVQESEGERQKADGIDSTRLVAAILH